MHNHLDRNDTYVVLKTNLLIFLKYSGVCTITTVSLVKFNWKPALLEIVLKYCTQSYKNLFVKTQLYICIVIPD